MLLPDFTSYPQGQQAISQNARRELKQGCARLHLGHTANVHLGGKAGDKPTAQLMLNITDPSKQGAEGVWDIHGDSRQGY